jgi:N6-adenosine-specific RNA methylase IME4
LIIRQLDDVINYFVVIDVIRNPNFKSAALSCNQQLADGLPTFDLCAAQAVLIWSWCTRAMRISHSCGTLRAILE